MLTNMLEAKNNLSRLVAAAERGEEVIVARDGVPVVRIVPYQAPKIHPPGAWQNKVAASPDWDSADTNAQVAQLMEGA